MPKIRPYQPSDLESWLRCRVLSFLHTCYYDDVWQSRPDSPAIQLIAADGETVIGLIDVEIVGSLATIETIAVHPDEQGRGIGSRILAEAERCLPRSVTLLDAWTREDASTLAWYRARGFEESEQYLHVYKGSDDSNDDWSAPPPLHGPVMAFAHGLISDERELRSRFRRVYVCRRFSKAVREDR
ncbi:MAG TPA: GNAT family N-acetyltransferase [Propionicimonas sp.]|nr:GNAT family N-acetyltransferase [Propionicimonas sp.]